MKKRPFALAALSLAVLLSLSAFPANAAPTEDGAGGAEAEDITQGCRLSASENADSLPNLKDRTVTTVWKASAGSTLTITSEEPIAGLYLSWDRDAAEWSLSAQEDGRALPLTDGGDDGFLHEYVPLTEKAYSLTLTLKEDAVLTDVSVLSPGRLPSWVQTWEPMLEFLYVSFSI